jgi:uncharacterized protein (UPF0332 family)
VFDPVDFYHLASKLHTDASDESALRSSVSRAYYAAFLWAREKAGVTSQGGNIHEKVINHYQLKKKSISNRLADLRQRHNDADYNLKKRVTNRNSGEALRLSKKIMEDLGVTTSSSGT